MKKSIFVIISLFLILSPIAAHAEWGAESEALENECENTANLEAVCLLRFQACKQDGYFGDSNLLKGLLECQAEHQDCLENLEDLCGEKDPMVQPDRAFIPGNLEGSFDDEELMRQPDGSWIPSLEGVNSFVDEELMRQPDGSWIR